MTGGDGGRIGPYAGNPFYWQMGGRPVLLLGGSVEDNLFQIDGLRQHLDLLASVGGNYVRCTMSSRDEGDLWPYARQEATGLYDLEEWNPGYWSRFERLIELAAEREIVVQVEFWATWDCYGAYRGWASHPCNPANNVNYTAEESSLPERVDNYPPERIQPFFETVPALRDLALVRAYQEAFVDRILEATLDQGHVLYCMDNETCADPEWGRYWCEYLRRRAAERGVEVHATEMWDNWDPSDGQVPRTIIQDESNHPYLHRANPKVTIAHPELYSFVEVSNHNAQRGRTHYETGLWVRGRLLETETVRPINNVKIYGADPELEFAGPPVCGERRFWRNIFAGHASARFHRPSSGLGLSETARAHIRSMRMLTNSMEVFSCRPAEELIEREGAEEVYCLADPGIQYAVCFLGGGRARLDCSELTGQAMARWLEIRESRWHEPEKVPAGPALELEPPGDGFWAALVTPAEERP